MTGASPALPRQGSMPVAVISTGSAGCPGAAPVVARGRRQHQVPARGGASAASASGVATLTTRPTARSACKSCPLLKPGARAIVVAHQEQRRQANARITRRGSSPGRKAHRAHRQHGRPGIGRAADARLGSAGCGVTG